MSLGGIGARAALLKQQKKTKRCERCGLRYAENKEQCPHCGHLDEAGLAQLKEQLLRRAQGRKKLGLWFFAGAVIILIVILLSVG